MNLAFLQAPIQGTSGTKCADVTISPSSGDIPLSVSLTTTQTGGHIFYRVAAAPGLAPVHNGDNAVSPTVRIGSNHGVVSINAGPPGSQRTIQAVCYQSGFLDSNITSGTYDVPESDL